MKITTIGRGTIGGTLGGLWTSAGHEVTELGRDGGDAAGSDVVLLAVPSSAAAVRFRPLSRNLAA
jgi:predicted dinucleotide-binding enzyme